MTKPRRRGLHIVRDDFFTKVIARSFRRSSSPNRTRFAGLRFGLPPCGRPCFWISASFSSTHAKTKGHPFGCPFVLGSAAQRAASPLGFQCSGSVKPPLRNFRPAAGNLRATRRAAQKGRFTSFDHLHLFRQHRTRRRGLHIVRDDFFIKVIARSFRRSSSPNRTRFAGLRFGLPPCGRSFFRICVFFVNICPKGSHALQLGFLFWGPTARGDLHPVNFNAQEAALPPPEQSTAV